MKRKAAAQGAVRHILQAVGIYLLASGKIDGATWGTITANLTTIVASVAAVAPVIWSIFDPNKKVGRGDPD